MKFSQIYFATLLISFQLFSYVISDEVCISDGQYCGTYENISETKCCGNLKCVMDAPHPTGCIRCEPYGYTFKCLDCLKDNGICGGPNDIKCCPAYGCIHMNSDAKPFGKCVRYP